MLFDAQANLLHMQTRMTVQKGLPLSAIRRTYGIHPRRQASLYGIHRMRGYRNRKAHGIECPAFCRWHNRRAIAQLSNIPPTNKDYREKANDNMEP
jgi:hypothetical protein